MPARANPTSAIVAGIASAAIKAEDRVDRHPMTAAGSDPDAGGLAVGALDLAHCGPSQTRPPGFSAPELGYRLPVISGLGWGICNEGWARAISGDRPIHVCGGDARDARYSDKPCRKGGAGRDTYTGCLAYGPGWTSVDDKGRRYTKIDCATRGPL